MDRFQYLGVMLACVAVTAPLEFVLGARVWRRPRRLVRVLGPVVAAFYLWDVVAIDRGHWSFQDRYVTGVVLPGGVPLEELVFFVVIPVCMLLSYEAVGILTDPVGRRRLRERFGAVLGRRAAPAGEGVRTPMGAVEEVVR